MSQSKHFLPQVAFAQLCQGNEKKAGTEVRSIPGKRKCSFDKVAGHSTVSGYGYAQEHDIG